MQVNPPLRVVRNILIILPRVHLLLAGKPGAMQGLIRLSGSLLETILVHLGCLFLQITIVVFGLGSTTRD